MDALLTAYSRAFRKDDPVRLVIKGFRNPHNDVPKQIEQLVQHNPDIAEIVTVNDELDDVGLHELYRNADAMVLPTRGEGFNLPAAEAMAAGIPLIVTDHGGHLDFCTRNEARLIKSRLEPSRSHLASAGSVWAEPDLDDLTAALRDVFDDVRSFGGRYASRAEYARQVIGERLDPDAWAKLVSDVATNLVEADRPRQLRVA